MRWFCRPVIVTSALILLLGIGCGDGDDDFAGTDSAVHFRPAASGPTGFGEIPWPSDLYLGDDGVVGALPGLERLVERPANIVRGLAPLDGFGRSTGAVFCTDREVDSDSLPSTWATATARDASAFLADVDVDSPRRGQRYPAYAKYLPGLGCISLIPVPGVVLPPGVRHAAVLTNRVRTVDGGRLVADAELARIAATGARATQVELLYGGAIDQLVGTGAVRRAAEIAGLAVFTTSSRAFELVELRARLHDEPEPELLVDASSSSPYPVMVFSAFTAPSLDDWLGTPLADENGVEWPGGDNPTGIAHDEIAAVVTAAFVAPSFLDRSTRRFERAISGGEYMLADPAALVPVTLVIPAQPAPPTGYPVVIHGHGLSNHRGSMFGLANEFARAGFAVIGIDDVLHGARGGAPDLQNNFPGGYDGPDGIPDTFDFPVPFFANFADYTAMADNFRQTVLDQCSLVRLIQSSRLDLTWLADVSGGAAPRLDPSRIYWSGGSLGGIIGAMTAAVEPNIAAAALQVPGASFIQLITTNSAELAPLVGAVADVTLGLIGGDEVDEFHPVALLLGTVTEAGDPIAYAPHVFAGRLAGDARPPDVLVTYAVDDEVLPNIATVALIRALGLTLASPRLYDLPGIPTAAAPLGGNRDGRTAAAVQYAPANHGLGYGRFDTRNFMPAAGGDGVRRRPLEMGFTFEQPVREHAAQLVGFLTSAAAGEPARVDLTAPPRADYDADGVLDEDERRAGTDPYDNRS